MTAEARVPVVAARGGSLLIEDRTPDEIFTPEDLSEEQVMIGQAADDFMVKELVPRLPELLKLDYELSRGLLRKAGERGLLGVEINRLLVPGRLIRRALKGELPIFQKAMTLEGELTGGPALETPEEGFLAAETRMLAGAKKVALMCLGTAVQKRGEALKDEQEVLGHLAGIAMETYALESALLRARKRAAARGGDAARLQAAAVRCYAQDAMDEIEASARKLLAAVEEGDTLRTLLAALKRFTKREVCNTRRRVADAAIERVGYPLG